MPINFKPLTVQNCFQNYFYEVPSYQREYVWEEKEVGQLIEDIFNEYTEDEEKEYFIGTTVTLQRMEGNGDVYELIDGQQRITTIYIILCVFRALNLPLQNRIEVCLRDEFYHDGAMHSRYRLSLQYEETNEVVARIAVGEKNPHNISRSGKRLVDAMRVIKQFLENHFNEDDELVAFFWYFFRKVKFIQIETDDISGALKVFETINERGIGLNSMDLLKNLLFREADPREFEQIKKRWERIFRLLDDRKEKPLRFLRYFVMANYDTNEMTGKIVREDQIYTWFHKNISQWSHRGDYLAFLDELNDGATRFVDFIKGRNHVSIFNIQSLGGAAFRQHLILLLAGKRLSPNMFDHLCKQFESLLFVYFITKENARNFEVKFSQWARRLRTVTTEQEYEQFIADTIRVEYIDRHNEFISRFRSLTTKKMPAYRVKYILAKLSAYIEAQRTGAQVEQIFQTYIGQGFEIEHIAPKRPTNQYRYKFANYEESLLKLGNIALLEKSINANIQNSEFGLKKDGYMESVVYLTKSIVSLRNIGTDTAQNRINARLRSFDDWTENEIDQRQSLLADIALDVWSLN